MAWISREGTQFGSMTWHRSRMLPSGVRKSGWPGLDLNEDFTLRAAYKSRGQAWVKSEPREPETASFWRTRGVSLVC